MTYRIIGSDLADAVADRIKPSGSTRELSYFPSAVTEKIQNELGDLPTGLLSAGILKKIIEEEQTSNLVDLFFRRSDMGWDRARGRSKLEHVAKIMGKALGWNDGKLKEQLDSYNNFIEKIFPSHH